MTEYEKIRRIFVYGMSAITYHRLVLPEVHELHRTAVHLDAVATLLLKRGDLIPPRIRCLTSNSFDFVDGLDSHCYNFR